MLLSGQMDEQRPELGHTAVDERARKAYRDYSIGERYERSRFSSPVGRYRLWHERRAVAHLLERVEIGARILDCPCGIGRWWPMLDQRGATVVGGDVSPGMCDHARQRADSEQLDIEVIEADAEALPFEDNNFDWVFCFALTKHLSRPTQYAVLAEFARVARQGVLCSFGLVNHFTYEIWRRRHRRSERAGTVQALPLLIEELEWMATCAGLQLLERRRCTTPIGVEYVCLFEQRTLPPYRKTRVGRCWL
jgi:ubiquinone/menaquinone biosynthesis C-methylase UbiE